ncbi:hypothetical protein BC830DRAFT_1162830 [Chytriomyces sp. MP71]|nr:hypothetical protein BC830DRAFT_1162830 [Chytriomyces sp. MP71]
MATDFLDPTFGSALEVEQAASTAPSPRERVREADVQLRATQRAIESLIAEGIQTRSTRRPEASLKKGGIAKVGGIGRLIRVIDSSKVAAALAVRWDTLVDEASAALDGLARVLVSRSGPGSGMGSVDAAGAAGAPGGGGDAVALGDALDAFAAFFEYRTHALVLALVPHVPESEASSVLLAAIHSLAAAVLRFFNILVESTRTDALLFLLFSNNYINDVILCRGFAVSRNESSAPSASACDALPLYATLIKNLSNKLDRTSINFFYNDNIEDFPLFTQAISLFESEERMVRICARTVILNVLSVNDENAMDYLINTQKCLAKMAGFWSLEIIGIEKLLAAGKSSALPEIQSAIDDCVDTLLFFQDVFALQLPTVSSSLEGSLLRGPISRLVTKALEQADTDPLIHLSIFLLSQVFACISYTSLVDSVLESLFSIKTEKRFHLLGKLLPEKWINGFLTLDTDSSLVCGDASVSMVLALLTSALTSHVSQQALQNCNLCSRQKIKARILVDSLTSSVESTSLGEIASTSSSPTRVALYQPIPYDVFIIGAFIDILGAVQSVHLRLLCLDFLSWVFERLVQTGEKDAIHTLTLAHLDILLACNKDWRSMISSLVNDGVDLVIDLLEFEVTQQPQDVSRLFKDSRILLNRAQNSASEADFEFKKEVRNLGFLVCMWKHTSLLLAKFGHPERYRLPPVDAIELNTTSAEGRVDLENRNVQSCIIYHGKYPPCNGYFIFDPTTFLLVEPDKLRPGKARVIFSKPVQQVTAVLVESDAGALRVFCPSISFANADDRRARAFACGGYNMVWQNAKGWDEVRIVFRAAHEARDVVFAHIETMKDEIQGRRRRMWMDALK